MDTTSIVALAVLLVLAVAYVIRRNARLKSDDRD